MYYLPEYATEESILPGGFTRHELPLVRDRYNKKQAEHLAREAEASLVSRLLDRPKASVGYYPSILADQSIWDAMERNRKSIKFSK